MMLRNAVHYAGVASARDPRASFAQTARGADHVMDLTTPPFHAQRRPVGSRRSGLHTNATIAGDFFRRANAVAADVGLTLLKNSSATLERSRSRLFRASSKENRDAF